MIHRYQNAQNRLIQKKAVEMGIGCQPLISGSEEFLELTYRDKHLIINKTRSHQMTLMSGLLAKNKEASNLLLRRRGLPVPDYLVVSELRDEATRFLERHRSIVVKPLDASNSVGVTLRVRDNEELRAAITNSLRYSDRVMLQQYVTGLDYRILVIGGQAAGVLEYVPAFIVGDGESTIRQLIDRLNTDQLRRNSDGEASSFLPVDCTSESLQAHLKTRGLTPWNVLQREERLELYGASSISVDTISEIVIDRSKESNPAILNAAVEAAAALQLDVAGIDIRCQDITSPLDEANGGILEVNALPDMVDPYLFLDHDSIDVVKLYLNYLFGE
ncbi:cyanophycin synthetase [Paenibacillaceae bacterium GAS479]|nr:cyanophycin synthetase [Paenibacillaceae bacterium GAS479]